MRISNDLHQNTFNLFFCKLIWETKRKKSYHLLVHFPDAWNGGWSNPGVQSGSSTRAPGAHLLELAHPRTGIRSETPKPELHGKPRCLDVARWHLRLVQTPASHALPAVSSLFCVFTCLCEDKTQGRGTKNSWTMKWKDLMTFWGTLSHLASLTLPPSHLVCIPCLCKGDASYPTSPARNLNVIPPPPCPPTVVEPCQFSLTHIFPLSLFSLLASVRSLRSTVLITDSLIHACNL